MRFAHIRLASDDACGRALKGLAMRMRITVLPDETFIVPESGLEWLRTEGLAFELLKWVSQDYVLQTLRNNLAHSL